MISAYNVVEHLQNHAPVTDQPDKDKKQDNLQDLLSQQSASSNHSSSTLEPSKKVERPQKAASVPKLQDELVRAADAASSAPRARKEATRGNSGNAQPSLQEMLHTGAQGNTGKRPSQADKSANQSVAHESLQALLSGAPNRAESPTKSATRSSKTRPIEPTNMNSSVDTQLAKQSSPQAVAPATLTNPDDPTTSAQRKGSKRMLWLVGLIGMVSLVVWLSAFMQPEAEPNLLKRLAKGAEDHHELLGEYPQHLSDLKEFPDNALEWPIEYWQARNAHGLTEIFWINEGATFQIIIRIGPEAWLYDHDGRVREISADTIPQAISGDSEDQL